MTNKDDNGYHLSLLTFHIDLAQICTNPTKQFLNSHHSVTLDVHVLPTYLFVQPCMRTPCYHDTFTNSSCYPAPCTVLTILPSMTILLCRQNLSPLTYLANFLALGQGQGTVNGRGPSAYSLTCIQCWKHNYMYFLDVVYTRGHLK